LRETPRPCRVRSRGSHHQRHGVTTRGRGLSETYYVSDHDRSIPVVLVRLSCVDREALRDLLTVSWRLTVEGAHTSASAAPDCSKRHFRTLILLEPLVFYSERDPEDRANNKEVV